MTAKFDHLEPVVALTGAGVSAESGVPTFRGEGGLWGEYRAEELATPQAFKKDPELVWRFYEWRRQLVRGCRPNRAHALLAELERAVGDFMLITQNVDGLHQRAGSRRLVELHGSLWRLKCSTCDQRWRDLAVPLDTIPPSCPRCGELARPDVIWFGEQLDRQRLERARQASERASTFLVIGTSALVEPAASLPRVAARAGATVVEFNLESTPITELAAEVYRGPASERLTDWWQEQKAQ